MSLFKKQVRSLHNGNSKEEMALVLKIKLIFTERYILQRLTFEKGKAIGLRNSFNLT